MDNDPASLTRNLVAPVDDGAAEHLTGLHLPSLSFTSTGGDAVNLRTAAQGLWVLFIYPTTGVPGEEMPRGWNEIPGALGCTPEACGFRDEISALHSAGARKVLALSSQHNRYQRELVEHLKLPYPMLSDPDFQLGTALGLPTFRADGAYYYKRLTMIVNTTRIKHVFYPVFPPDEHATQVVEWLWHLP